MNVTKVLTSDYENNPPHSRAENKPNSNPIKPNFKSSALTAQPSSANPINQPAHLSLRERFLNSKLKTQNSKLTTPASRQPGKPNRLAKVLESSARIYYDYSDFIVARMGRFRNQKGNYQTQAKSISIWEVYCYVDGIFF